MTSRHPQAVTAIRSRSTFQALRRPAGRGVSGPVAVAFVPPLPGTTVDAGAVRVGYVVGRTCGNAVGRNHLRRRFRAAVRESSAGLPAGAYLVRAEPAAVGLPYHSLVTAVSGAMTDAAAKAGAVSGGASVGEVPGR
jgi:ribonuclease P protein component